MINHFFKHINKFIEVDKDEFKEIMPFFDLSNIRKKEIISEANHKCNFNHFVLNGCLQMYFINNKGVERTVQFAIENWWITDCLDFHNQGITSFYIQAIENSQILSISVDKQKELLDQFPKLEKYFRIIYQISFGASQMKMKYLYEFSKEEIYFNFIDKYPDFAQRIPQYLLASYLGLTPEYVSEIRNKKRS
ncbi:Crp/Fnr family transcriptional regulator [Tenacibaculum finnmarkense genomovar ulcerans]|uniref:Crp/Fnr family transcriptional regulator n=1 Tax=Tenacibaculum finnmarkense TaxID=2781243 RepID=UPI0007390F6F|nr:Crp/Fnr family transcriptional regulator [Tenacibaculum finnmarkense]ALU75176.1 cyclic nucleotide-binding protein [Tenacibaculum dicentrarchi]MBE7634675.1 Crp/Fnr family transcriptional regulator [Tenacibaculum finnmarkense genomovar ulcerans]MCD8430813.1 Crp/Fnr family transcriptional regulator [Tenacibaculum finnmarkense genomovar ulcerans]